MENNQANQQARGATENQAPTPVAEAAPSKRVAVYARLAEADVTVVPVEERDELYVDAAERLGCAAVQIYEDYDAKGYYGEFLSLIGDFQSGAYDAVMLFDLTVGFARWRPYERKLAECGIPCLKAGPDVRFACGKANRWQEYRKQKREKEWQDWVLFRTLPALTEPEDE